MSIIDSLPGRALKPGELELLKDADGVGRVEEVLSLSDAVFSFVIEIHGHAVGLHCDHETAEWQKVTEGEDFESVFDELEAWVNEDIDRVVEEREGL